jgi:hypothetical protein
MASTRLYANPAFVVFWSARTISFAGTGITGIVLPVLVYRMTGSAADVAALLVLETSPYVMAAFLAASVQMLSPDHLQARVNTAGRLIAYGGQPVGALLGGLLAEVLPIRLTFAALALAVAVGAGLAGWACLGSRPLSAISISAPLTVP